MHPLLQAFLLSIPSSALFLGIVFHENIIRYIGQKRCQKGYHTFKDRKYHCKRCKKGRDWPKLTCISGEKMERPKFPGI